MAVRASLEPIPMARPGVPSPAAPSPSAFVDDAPAPVASSTPSLSSQKRAPAASDAGVSFSPQEQEARARIAARISEFEGKNHWQLLGVEQSADATAIKKAYFALSRDVHPDSFAGLNLGAAQQQLETVFATITDAYAVLTDPNKRGEYEAKVKLEEGGGSSDIGAIFAAESDFNRIKNLVERGELAGAQKLIGKVAAVLGNSEEARGYKLFLDWWPMKNPTTAPAIIKELQELHKAAPAAHALAEFQGWIHLEIGNAAKARSACWSRSRASTGICLRLTRGS
jgi:curved DNA-binding protein CbpA